MSHQRLKTETDHLVTGPALQNNFFADVVQASQGGLNQYAQG